MKPTPYTSSPTVSPTRLQAATTSARDNTTPTSTVYTAGAEIIGFSVAVTFVFAALVGVVYLELKYGAVRERLGIGRGSASAPSSSTEEAFSNRLTETPGPVWSRVIRSHEGGDPPLSIPKSDDEAGVEQHNQ
jgi:hypothetical protein